MPVAQSIPLSATSTIFNSNGEDKIYRLTLQNKSISVELTNIGCAITAIRTPDKNNVTANIVAGYDDLSSYLINKDYFGCVVGRYSNRIANGSFQLGDRRYQLSINDGNNHLHGGTTGFSRRLWKIHKIIENDEACGVIFTYFSHDGEEGYPGNLFVSVKYTLDNFNRLCLSYQAVTDQPTPISLTNHSYFNLSGFKEPFIYDHLLSINADTYTVKSCNNIPTGEIAKVKGTPLDFRNPKPIGKDINAFPLDLGFDHNFILDTAQEPGMMKAAVLKEINTGRVVKVYTHCPAVQVYTSNFWDGSVTGEQGFLYQQHGAVALETQAFPDSPNHAHFPNTILRPGETFNSSTMYEFGVE